MPQRAAFGSWTTRDIKGLLGMWQSSSGGLALAARSQRYLNLLLLESKQLLHSLKHRRDLRALLFKPS